MLGGTLKLLSYSQPQNGRWSKALRIKIIIIIIITIIISTISLYRLYLLPSSFVLVFLLIVATNIIKSALYTYRPPVSLYVCQSGMWKYTRGTNMNSALDTKDIPVDNKTLIITFVIVNMTVSFPFFVVKISVLSFCQC